MARRGFQFAVYDIDLLDFSVHMIETVDIDVIQAQIRCAEELIIPCHLHALHMRPEVALRDAAHALMENLIRDIADRSVLIQLQNGDLPIVVSGDKEPGIRVVCGQIGSAHAVDPCPVHKLKTPSLHDPVSFHPEIRDRIQEFLIV